MGCVKKSYSTIQRCSQLSGAVLKATVNLCGISAMIFFSGNVATASPTPQLCSYFSETNAWGDFTPQRFKEQTAPSRKEVLLSLAGLLGKIFHSIRTELGIAWWEACGKFGQSDWADSRHYPNIVFREEGPAGEH
jgi:hypothetical protein